jgi:hypothetical protein
VEWKDLISSGEGGGVEALRRGVITRWGECSWKDLLTTVLALCLPPPSSLKLTQPPRRGYTALSFSAVPGVIRFTFFSKPRIFQDGKDFYVYCLSPQFVRSQLTI